MGVRILHNDDDSQAVLYCSVSDWAFGPVFYETDEASAAAQAEVFAHWLPQDARRYSDSDLARQYSQWQGLEKCWEHRTITPCASCLEIDEEVR
jgi:hypothetical protein